MEPTNIQNPRVNLFTDGACIGNPGPGGWAFILVHSQSGRSRESTGSEPATTNNRMEITAVIRGLEALKRPCHDELFSDSEYVVNAISSWIVTWKGFGWRRSARSTKEIRNIDLWQKLENLLQQHAVKANWVRGHAGHKENERCDQLATRAAAMIATPADLPA